MNKQVIIIVSCFIFVLFVISSLFLLLSNDQKEATGPTGGSGMLPVGSLILYGYETPSNSELAISVGTYFTVDQQAVIESSLEDILFEADPQREYIGTITQGSVEVEHLTSTVTFDVDIENPAKTYTVSYNTITDDIAISEKGETAG